MTQPARWVELHFATGAASIDVPDVVGKKARPIDTISETVVSRVRGGRVRDHVTGLLRARRR
jgi:hypothetical protein